MSQICVKLKVLAKIDFIGFFGLFRGQISLKYRGSIFPAPSTSFYDTIFKMATSRLNMPHNEPSKLHTLKLGVQTYVLEYK